MHLLRCRLMDSQSMTGEDLRSLLLSKWGRSYDARLHTRNGRCATLLHLVDGLICCLSYTA